MQRLSRKLFLVLLLFTLTNAPAQAQTGDVSSKNLQIVLDSAMIDFRDYRSAGGAVPSLSTNLTKVTCQMNTWANNVPMYVCYAQTPLAAADTWFRSVVENAKRLETSWTFKLTGNGDTRYADGGPENCEVALTEGPYVGQCPFHAQYVREAGGLANLYLWINSFSSPYLLRHAPSPKPVSHTAPPCDDFCQSFKKVLAARINAFAELGAPPNGEEVSVDASVRFPGARKCSISRSRISQPAAEQAGEGTEFVCYWQEASTTAADNRFRDLVSRVQALIPADWPSRQQEESDAATGAKIMSWLATGGRSDVRIYISGVSVALHVTARMQP